MRNKLIYIAIFATLFISACATFEPDDGRHWRPPTLHFEPYQPKKPAENTTNSYTVLVSGETVLND